MPTDGEPSVTAVVLNWNGGHLLDTVLGSLERQDYGNVRTVVVDNGSSDGSADLVRERWPRARLVSLPANVGITAGLNCCVDAAAGSEFVALVNNDVELDPRWLSELVGALAAEPRAASASGKVLSHARPELIDRAGDEMAWSGEAVCRGAGELDRGQYDLPAEVFGTSAAAALFRTAAFEAVGPFDEQFGAYHEDTDWCFRARLMGWTSLYAPTAVALHIGSASAGRDSDFALYHGMRNAVWVIAKNYPARSLTRHAPELARRHARMVFDNTRCGRLPLLARAWRDALRGLPAVLAKRREVQRRATVDAAALEPVLRRPQDIVVARRRA